MVTCPIRETGKEEFPRVSSDEEEDVRSDASTVEMTAEEEERARIKEERKKRKKKEQKRKKEEEKKRKEQEEEYQKWQEKDKQVKRKALTH